MGRDGLSSRLELVERLAGRNRVRGSGNRPCLLEEQRRRRVGGSATGSVAARLREDHSAQTRDNESGDGKVFRHPRIIRLRRQFGLGTRS